MNRSWKYILFLACVAQGNQNYNATCVGENTLVVHIPYDKTAEIVRLEYGQCDLSSSSGVQNLVQNSDFSFTIMLDIYRGGKNAIILV